MPPSKETTKRYNLALPTALFDELQQEADKRNVSVVELLRKFIKLGLIVIRLEDKKANAQLLIREGNTERQLVIL